MVTEDLPHARSVALGCWVGVGNRDEPVAHAGVSHFLEHLAFKGTASRSSPSSRGRGRSGRAIAEAIDATGGDMNAFTTKEYTAFELRLPARHLDFAVDVLCDVVGNPALRPGDVASERQVILEELHLQNDEPDDVVFTELYAALFPEHPLGWEIVGTEDTIASMTPDAIRAFHDEWYRPANLVVAAAGPVDHDALVAAVVRFVDDGTPGRRPERVAPVQEREARRAVQRPGESAHVALGWPSLSQGDPERFALYVLNQLLGVGLSSRLFQEVREERGLAYSVFSSLSSYADTGVFTVYAGTTPARVDELLDVVDAQIRDLVERGPGEQELVVAQGAFEGSTLIHLEDTGSRMARLATGMVLRDEVLPVDDYLAAIAAVRADDVQRVAARVLGAAPTIAIVGPEG